MDSSIEKKVDEILAGMDEKSCALTRPILEEYLWYVSQADAVQRTIDIEGPIIKVEKGGPNNRHIERVEHPGVKIVVKFSSQAAGHYVKLMRYLSKAEMDQVDDLEAFLKNR